MLTYLQVNHSVRHNISHPRFPSLTTSTNRHRQSPPPNHHHTPHGPLLRDLDPPQRRPHRLLQRHAHAPHRHRRLRLGPIRRLPLRAPRLRGTQPLGRPPVPHPQLRPVLRLGRLRGPHQQRPLRTHRARPHPAADPAARRGASVLGPAGLYPQALVPGRRWRAARPLPRPGRHVLS